MTNPVHPKTSGGFFGALSGGGIGEAVNSLITQSAYYHHLNASSQDLLSGLVVVGGAAVGQFVLAWLSKWEPAASKDAGALIHVLDPEETQAAAESWLDAKWSALKTEVLGAAADPTNVHVLPSAPVPGVTVTDVSAKAATVGARNVSTEAPKAAD